jgi:hypothetical protein
MQCEEERGEEEEVGGRAPSQGGREEEQGGNCLIIYPISIPNRLGNSH